MSVLQKDEWAVVVADSPQWRKGPRCKPVLCNACGTRFLRTRSLGKVSHPCSIRHLPLHHIRQKQSSCDLAKRSQTQSKLNTSAQHQYIPLDVAGVRTEPCQLLVAVARYNLMHGP